MGNLHGEGSDLGDEIEKVTERRAWENKSVPFIPKMPLSN